MSEVKDYSRHPKNRSVGRIALSHGIGAKAPSAENDIMLRRLFSITSALSALLLLTVCTAVAATFILHRPIQIPSPEADPPSYVLIDSHETTFRIDEPKLLFDRTISGKFTRLTMLGFVCKDDVFRYYDGTSEGVRILIVPHWWLMATFALVPILFVRVRWPRTWHILFSGLAVCCILLCIATLALWPRSYWKRDGIQRMVPNSYIYVCSSRGKMGFYATPQSARSLGFDNGLKKGEVQYDFFSYPCQPHDLDTEEVFNSLRVFKFAGFYYAYDSYDNEDNSGWGTLGACPDWAVVTLLSIVPACWLAKHRRSRIARRKGHCRCGYNLTGNISGVCPECGDRVVSPQRVEEMTPPAVLHGHVR